MIKVMRTFTRPNINVLWHDQVIDTTPVFDYDGPDGRVDNIRTLSEDFLNAYYTDIWASQEAFDNYLLDPKIINYIEERDNYCNLMGIIVGPRTVEPL